MWRGYLRYAAQKRDVPRNVSFFYIPARLSAIRRAPLALWRPHWAAPAARLFHLDLARKCHAFSVPQANRVFLYTTRILHKRCEIKLEHLAVSAIPIHLF